MGKKPVNNTSTALLASRLAAAKAQAQILAARNQQLTTMLAQYGEVTGQFATALRNLERHVEADYPKGLPKRINLGLKASTRQAIGDAVATIARLMPNRSKMDAEPKPAGDDGPEGRAGGPSEQAPGRQAAEGREDEAPQGGASEEAPPGDQAVQGENEVP